MNLGGFVSVLGRVWIHGSGRKMGSEKWE